MIKTLHVVAPILGLLTFGLLLGCGGSVPAASAEGIEETAPETAEMSGEELDPATLTSCEQVVDAYTSMVAPPQQCQVDADCHILLGACDRGLGSCFYAVRTEVTAADALPLVERFEELECVGARCRCAAPPAMAVCNDGACAPG